MDERLAIMLGSNTLTLAVLLTACGGASAIPPAASKPTPQTSPVPWCITPGSEVDSTFAVAQARPLFASPDLPLKPHSVQRVIAHLEGKNSKDSTFSLNVPE